MVVKGVTLSKDSIVTTSIIELIVAAVLYIVASGLMRGRRGFQTAVAIVVGIRMASAVGLMLFHHGGA